jgi:hypothetical protein
MSFIEVEIGIARHPSLNANLIFGYRKAGLEQRIFGRGFVIYFDCIIARNFWTDLTVGEIQVVMNIAYSCIFRKSIIFNQLIIKTIQKIDIPQITLLPISGTMKNSIAQARFFDGEFVEFQCYSIVSLQFNDRRQKRIIVDQDLNRFYFVR